MTADFFAVREALRHFLARLVTRDAHERSVAPSAARHGSSFAEVAVVTRLGCVVLWRPHVVIGCHHHADYHELLVQASAVVALAGLVVDPGLAEVGPDLAAVGPHRAAVDPALAAVGPALTLWDQAAIWCWIATMTTH